MASCGIRTPGRAEGMAPRQAVGRGGHSGLYTTNGAVLSIIRRSKKERPEPDLFLFGLPGSFHGYFITYAEELVAQRNRFTWAILKGHTNNTGGTVRLRTADPRDVPDVNFRYFDEGTDAAGEDLASVVEGVKFVRRVMRHPLLPGP